MMKMLSWRKFGLFTVLFTAAVLVAGCTLDMVDQPRYDAFEESAFFADRSSARPRIQDTVARGQLRLDAHRYTGRADNKLTESFPFTVTLTVLERGRNRYDIFCAPCHGLVGDGNGPIIGYGMKTPPSLHDPEMRDEPAGFYFETITDGTRVMPAYGARIAPDDRWAIVAYVRALQLSQNASPAEVPADQLPLLEQTDTITQ